MVLEFYEGRDNPFDLEKGNDVFYISEEYDGKKIGYIQFYQLDNKTKKEYGYFTENVYGTDQFIGEIAYWNKGIGTLLVKSMIKFIIEDKMQTE